jgi:hypothetical protein
LREEFGLVESEFFYEIPWDGIIAAALLGLPGGDLPKWKGVRYMKQSDSTVYQEFAASEAQLRGISRVHLDTFLWK